MIIFLSIIAYSSIFILIYIYLGYPILLTLLSLLFPAPKIKKDKIRPTVSLIISCYNEEEVLPQKLANSLGLEYPKGKLEIIVISDASTDRTDEIALAHKKQGVKLIRREGRLGKTMGLNWAVPQSKGEIIVFSDANAIYKSDAIVKMVENFADETVGYVVGEAKYINANKTAAAKSENTYWQYEIFIKKMESKLHSMVGGDGAIYAIRQELYEELKQSDINDFVNPLQIITKGYRGIYEPTAICFEDTAGSFDKEFKRKTRIVNRAFSGLLRVKNVLNPFRTGVFSFEIISHKLLRWMAPFFILTFIIPSILLSLQGNMLFQFFSAMTTLFLILATIGYLIPGRTKVFLMFHLPYYFMSVNVASLIGIVKSLKGDIQITWETNRSTKTDSAISKKNSLHYIFFTALLMMGLIVYTDHQNLIEHFTLQTVFWLLLVITVYTYFGYPLILLFWAKASSLSIVRADITPSVALLICAYNEEEVIEEKIRNSLKLDYPVDKLIVIIASDGSSDRTNEIVRKHISPRLELYEYKERQGKIGVIIASVPKIDADIIIFSDANTMYAPDAINKIVRNFNDPSVGAVSADVILQNNQTSFGRSESVYYLYERWIQNKETKIGSIIGADGGMYGIRRELFHAPSHNIILDDFVISMSIALKGYRVVCDCEAVGYEKSTISAKEEFQRKSRVIAGAIQAMKQCEGVPWFNQPKLLFCYFSHKFLRWMAPLLLLLLIFSNLLLALFLPAKIYSIGVLLQILFYCLAAIGFFSCRYELKISLFSIPYYFCMENGAALCGIYKGLFNKQQVTWRKFARDKYTISNQ